MNWLQYGKGQLFNETNNFKQMGISYSEGLQGLNDA
jgi:hypothetical protein